MTSRFNYIKRLALCALVASAFVPSAFAQNGSGRVRVDANIGAKDPFAQRAARGSQTIPTSPAKETPKVDNDRSTSASKTTVKPAQADADLVYLQGASEPIACVVVSVSGKDGLKLKADERVATYALNEVERVELSAPESYALGVEAFNAGMKRGLASEYDRALELFKTARDDASRRIEKELATCRIVETYQALGRDDEAAAEFFILCRLDPYSAYLRSAPLRWHERNSLSRGSSADSKQLTESVASQWLSANANPSQGPNPAARLLAASLLLNSRQYGQDAVDAMQQLASATASDDATPDEAETTRVIALLATAQLWRQTILRKPTERDLQRWERTVALLPGAYRVEPSLLIAEARRALGQDAEAATAFLRVATLAQTRFTLAEYAAKEAADAFERAGDAAQAQLLRADSRKRFESRR